MKINLSSKQLREIYNIDLKPSMLIYVNTGKYVGTVGTIDLFHYKNGDVYAYIRVKGDAPIDVNVKHLTLYKGGE